MLGCKPVFWRAVCQPPRLFLCDPHLIRQAEIIKDLPEFSLRGLGGRLAECRPEVYRYRKLLAPSQFGEDLGAKTVPQFRRDRARQVQRREGRLRCRAWFGPWRGFRLSFGLL